MQRFVAGQCKGFDHRVGGAGMAQGVVVFDGAIEAGEHAVDELPAVFDLATEKLGGRDHLVANIASAQLGSFASAHAGTVAMQLMDDTVFSTKNASGLKQVDLCAGVVLCGHHRVQCGRITEALFHVDRKVAQVERGQRHVGAAVEDGVGVDFLFGQRGFQRRVESDALPEIVALVTLETLQQLGPGQ